ncbi:MAG: acyltransferase [Porphyromonadaceae bacterium]|jgi:galactoside O-acetyltransferase|nr:acyltransferase [Porphyromonadaceae bacterium]
MNSFYTQEELQYLGFKKIGRNVLISKKASFYGVEKISIGDSVRIDDFCILSGSITLGSHIHVSAFCALYGRNGIELQDYTGLSPRCTVFSASDDFSGDFLISPMVEKEFTNVTGGKVLIKKYTQIGASSVVLPNLTIGEGVAVGAMSLINKSLTDWGIFAGIPAEWKKERSKGLLKFIGK